MKDVDGTDLFPGDFRKVSLPNVREGRLDGSVMIYKV